MQIMLLGSGMQYGEELVTNGDFSSSSGWTVPEDWEITGGEAVHTAGIGVLSGTVAPVGAWEVEVTYTILDFAGSGDVYVAFDSMNGTARSANGTYTQVFTTTPGSASITFNPSGTATFAIDGVSARRKFY